MEVDAAAISSSRDPNHPVEACNAEWGLRARRQLEPRAHRAVRRLHDDPATQRGQSASDIRL